MNVLMTDTGEFSQIVHVDPVTQQDNARQILESASCFYLHFTYDERRSVWLCSNAVYEASQEVLNGFENP